MYKEHLWDHYKHPRKKERIPMPNCTYHEHNPSCGDELTIDFTIDDGVIKDVGWAGRGCVISLSAASMLCEELPGMKVEDVIRLPRDDMLEMLGIDLHIMRIKCGLLALHTAKKGLCKYLGSQEEGEW